MEKRLIQITAGEGPAECTWVVAKVLKYLLKEAKGSQIEAEVVSKENGDENRTLSSAMVALKGKEVDLFLKDWIGTIQWVGESPFRKFHKRKNWFVGVFPIEGPESGKKEVKITYQAIRSGGPGGQHVNKVSTAIRAIDEVSGLSVLVSEHRSQLQNKKLATARLMTLIENQQNEINIQQNADKWKQHKDLERGNPIRVFKGSDFKSQKMTSKKVYQRNREKHQRDIDSP